MDAARFDAVTKALATSGFRRQMLVTLLATVAGVLAPGWLASAKRKQGSHHRNHKKNNHHRKGKRKNNGDNRSHDVRKSGDGKKKRNKKNEKKNKNDNKNPTPQPAPTPTPAPDVPPPGTETPAPPPESPPSPPPPSGCPSGLTACNGQCVNLQNDPNNCGLCGFSCAQFSPNTQCVNGSCPCDPGTAFCPDPNAPSGGTCTPLGTVEHCLNCADRCTGNPCEVVTCDPAAGCQRTAKPDDEACGDNRFCKAGICIDYTFPDTLKLPWCAGEKEPRTLTQDWEGHVATGIALDFGRRANPGEDVKGTLVLAPVGGTVVRNSVAGSLGKHALIDVGNGWQVILAHLDEFDADLGDSVNTGDVIGTLGGSGATGPNDFPPHIHIDLAIGVGNQRYKPDITKLARMYGHPRDEFDCPEGSDCGSHQTFFSTQRQCSATSCEGKFDGTPCAPNKHRCCGGVCCQDGGCELGQCFHDIRPCVGSSNCAPQQHCDRGLCSSCGRAKACADDLDCCSIERCLEGVCSYVTCEVLHNCTPFSEGIRCVTPENQPICDCVATTEGRGVCVTWYRCGDSFPICSSTADCPENTVCIPGDRPGTSCCTGNVSGRCSPICRDWAIP